MKNDYIYLKPLDYVAKEISYISKAIGFEDILPTEKQHLSLIYDDANSWEEDEIESVLDPETIYTATTKGLSVLGEGDKRAIVILLDSEDLVERHNELSGMVPHSFKDFVPHVTIKYNASDEDVQKAEAFSDFFAMTIPSVVLSGESIQKGEE